MQMIFILLCILNIQIASNLVFCAVQQSGDFVMALQRPLLK